MYLGVSSRKSRRPPGQQGAAHTAVPVLRALHCSARGFRRVPPVVSLPLPKKSRSLRGASCCTAVCGDTAGRQGCQTHCWAPECTAGPRPAKPLGPRARAAPSCTALAGGSTPWPGSALSLSDRDQKFLIPSLHQIKQFVQSWRCCILTTRL